MLHKNIILRPQDSVILMKITVNENEFRDWNTVTLSRELFISQSEVSESIKRSIYSGLIYIANEEKKVSRNSFFDFAVYGIKYVFPVRPGPVDRGMPTAHSALPLKRRIVSEDVFVWPDPKGESRGHTVESLYKTVPQAAKEDPLLYEMLALVDSIRVGRVRERSLAEEELRKRILKDTK
jgi:hypothetical protein